MPAARSSPSPGVTAKVTNRLVESRDSGGVTTARDDLRMPVLDYRQLVNRELPLQERACTSKVAFLSRRDALSRCRHGRMGYSGLKPYRCDWCGDWHLGHRRRRR